VGAKVIAAASTDEKCALCKTHRGRCHHQLHARKTCATPQGADRWQGPGRDLRPGRRRFAEPAFRSIAWRGRYLVVGFAAGPIPSLPLNLALLKGASIVGVFWGDFARREPKANAAMMAELAQWYGQGKIKPVIDRAMPMANSRPPTPTWAHAA
jgi:NADPH2:quinone reductase